MTQRQVGPDGRLVVTFAWPSAEFALNQLLWFDRLQLTDWLLVTLDSTTHARMCERADVPARIPICSMCLARIRAHHPSPRARTDA